VALPLALTQGGEQLPWVCTGRWLELSWLHQLSPSAASLLPLHVGVWEGWRLGRLSSAGLPTAGRFPKKALSVKKTSF